MSLTINNIEQVICVHYYKVLMVFGGMKQDKTTYFDSTEINSPSGLNPWITVAAKLPFRTIGLVAITIENRVLLFGRTFKH